MKQKTHLPFLSPLQALVLLLVTTCIGCIKIKTNLPEKYYYNGDKKINIDFVDDTIGIILKRGQPIVSVKNILQTQGYTLVRNLSEDIALVVSTSNTHKNHAELIKSVRELKDNNQNLVLRAGYFITPVNSQAKLMVTNEIIIEFKPGKTQNGVDSFLHQNKVQIIQKNPAGVNQYLVSDTLYDALKKSQDLKKDSSVRFVFPNFIVPKTLRRSMDDPMLLKQWYLDNAEGSEDADIDADKAWDYTTGKSNILIAIIDNGFDINHDDLRPNLAINRPEWTGGDLLDDDGNGYLNDSVSWNFGNCGSVPCGNNKLDASVHGTGSMGMAGAKGNNGVGISGSCPDCSILPIEFGLDINGDVLAFEYAEKRGARIISCSWAYTGLDLPVNLVNEINKVHNDGITIFFAMSDNHEDLCDDAYELSSLPSVIAVSGSTDKDQFDNIGFGNCMDILAPYYTGGGLGSTKIVTTDISGAGGYNDGVRDYTNRSEIDWNYTLELGGTSMATPLAAGVAALLLSLDNSLTPDQIQHLLQDCADKVEPGAAAYRPVDGFSMPASGASTHGFGRINAFEAARIAAPRSNGSNKKGLGGVDIFVRDNDLDWGNTEQPSNTLFEPTRKFIPHWRSVDIKVDAPPFYAIPLNNTDFDSHADENPIAGMNNKIYIRVRNRGYKPATDITVKLHWVYAGLAFPHLPIDFWSRFPDNSTDITEWHPIGVQRIPILPYSGPSTAQRDIDAPKIVSFDFTAPVPDVSLPNHYCLMALIDSPDDPLKTPELISHLDMDYVTSHFNNATHKNMIIENLAAGAVFKESFFVYNPSIYFVDTYFNVQNEMKAGITLDNMQPGAIIHMMPGEKKLIHIEVNTKMIKQPFEITLQQFITGYPMAAPKLAGGLTLSFER